MLNGFIRVASASPSLLVGDIAYNTNCILNAVNKANNENVKIIVFPELSITGATLESLYFQDAILEESLEAVYNIAKASVNFDMVIVVSLPYKFKNNIYNTAFVIKDGLILGIVPKSANKIDKSHSHDRIFSDGSFIDEVVEINDFVNDKTYTTPFSKGLIFRATNDKNISFTIEIGSDSKLDVSDTPSAVELASIVLNPNTNSDTINYEKNYFINEISKSEKLSIAYISCGANVGESSSKEVYCSKSIICECGDILTQRDSLSSQAIICDIDVDKIIAEKKNNDFLKYVQNDKHIDVVDFEFNSLSYENDNILLNRYINPMPYLPNNKNDYSYAFKILNIQALALAKRISHVGVKNVVLGLSGGLDSSLALIVCLRCFDILGLDKSGIKLFTMPCFGTGSRTYNNALNLAKCFGLEIKELNIENSVKEHFNLIEHDIQNTNVTFENAQARERTQILLDIANDVNGIVIGTGDLSESALGFATYNGDQMSSYNVNCSIPKTLIRYMFSSFIQKYEQDESTKNLSLVLKDILNQPISPELLPQNGNNIQMTEKAVGPYEINDFALFYTLKYGYMPKKVLEMCIYTFGQQKENLEYRFSKELIIDTIKSFYKRFILNAYKRNASPEGPSIGLPSLNNHNDFYFPSDVSYDSFLMGLDKI